MDFTRKARMCARGDQTEPPSTLTHSSVVSRESVRLAFLIAALNDLDCEMFDIGNAYLNAPTTEKLYVPEAGIEFGENAGKVLIITRALYGLKLTEVSLHKVFKTWVLSLVFLMLMCGEGQQSRKTTPNIMNIFSPMWMTV